MAKSTDYETKRMNDAYWLFWVYQAAHMPRMLSWAKKKNKGQELQSMKDLLSSYDRSTHKIVYGLAPKAFDNMIQMLNAVHSTTYKEFSDEYFRVAPDAAAARSGMPAKEFFSTQGNKTNLDETLRLGICYSYLADMNNITPEDKALAAGVVNDAVSYFMYDKFHDDAWELKDNIVMWNSICKTLSEVFVNYSMDEVLEHYNISWIQDVLFEVFSWSGVSIFDFWKAEISRKDIEKISKLVATQIHNKHDIFESLVKVGDKLNKDDLDIDALEELGDEFVSRAEKLKHIICAFLLFYKLVLMYKDATSIANKATEENIELKNSIASLKNKNALAEEKARKKLEKEKDASLAADKQKKLNHLQSNYERLQQKYKELEQENAFLNRILRNQEEATTMDEGREEPVVEDIAYPNGTVLFGGHPNWQKKFAAKYPNVKILDGTNHNFPENVVSSKTPLVLLNSYHMSHTVFQRVKQLQQKMGWKIEYMRYGGSV